jgi:peptidoglycan/xylan/chitin deacetylase (PgdA/CDA1 family)
MQKNKIALSFDVEDWFHTPAISGSSFAKYPTIEDFFADWKGKIDCLSDGFNSLIKLLDKYDIKATFFIVADVIERYPHIVTELKKRNHEIQCHSLHHVSAIDSKTKKDYQTKELWEKELVEAKQIIEKTFNTTIYGYRAPGAYFANWMVEILERNGFKYDSSVAYNSVYNKTNVLLKDIPTFPYQLNSVDLSNKNPNSNVIELPWSHFKVSKLILPAAGAFFYRLLGNLYFDRVLNQCLKNGDTMFYMHPLDFSNEKIPLTSNKTRPAYWINMGDTTLHRFEKFLIKYKQNITTCDEVYTRYLTKQ